MKTLSNGTLLVACVGGILGAATLASAGPSQYIFEMSKADQSDWLVTDARDLVIVDIYMEFENATDFLQSVFGSSANQLSIATDDPAGFFKSSIGAVDTTTNRNSGLVATAPSMAADSWVTIGLEDQTGNALQNIGINFTDFNNGTGGISVDNGTWFVTDDDPQGTAGNYHCNRMLLARMTVAEGSSLTVSLNFQYREAGGAVAQILDQSISVTATAEANWVASANINDFDGNGTADFIIRECVSGANPFSVQMYLSTLGGGSPAYQSDYVTQSSLLGWSIIGYGDFDGDGDSDLLWAHDSTGTFSLWLMDTTLLPAKPYVAITMSGTMAGYTQLGTGDFDGNGTIDILFQDVATGGTEMWLMSNSTPGSYTQRTVYASAPSGWNIRCIGDLDGDGDADILWQREKTSSSAPGAVSCWLIDTSIVAPDPPYASKSIYAFNLTAWSIYGLADWDADGDDDLIWRHDTIGAISSWKFGGVSGNNLLYNATTITNSGTSAWELIAFGDYNGDGHVDLMWQYEAGTGVLSCWLMNADPEAYTGWSYSSVPFSTEPLEIDNVLQDGDH